MTPPPEGPLPSTHSAGAPQAPSSSIPHNASKPIPLPLALAILAAIFAGGIFVLWKYVYRPPAPPNPIRTITPLPGAPRVAGGPPSGNNTLRQQINQLAAEAQLPDGVHNRGPEDYLVKAGDAYMRVRRLDGHFKYAFGYFTPDDQEWEHGYLTQGVRRILNEEDYAKELNITPDQRAKLEGLPLPPKTTWPQADRDRLIALYKNEESRPQLITALGEYATSRREAEQKLRADRIRQIRAILTPAQTEKINPIPRWPLTPASAPSAPDRAPHDP